MKRVIILMFFLAVAGLTISACGDSAGTNENTKTNEENGQPQSDQNKKGTEVSEYPQFMEVQENEKVAVIHTTKGDIKVKLYPEEAPKTVENFITHSKDGYYDGVIFHRVIQDFMVQTGDPQGTGAGGESIWGEPFEDEFSNKLANFRGALSMANRGPDTNGSQFFIVQKKDVGSDMIQQMQEVGFPEEIIDLYKEHGGTPTLDGRHAVFGHVIEGMDVVDEIANVKTDANDRPAEEIKIESIEIVKE
ncbi:peptidylprolyl isomerase [Bacillus marinisedimentorum]|uniref:peptidylprolyl isomerase n=1 Tax=Bacillus marinisedimentorum TaxID=1821260 RepID=UPI000872031A|nr:peptidylprolyl isomerase [Bacillus marinisedimentorum]